ELCTRAVWMHKGEILMNGPAEAVAEKYRWWAWNVAKGKEDISDKLLHDVLSNAVKEEINILEPELVKNPVPRHAARPMSKKAKKLASKQASGARHLKRRETADIIEETPVPLLASAESQVWPEKLEAPRTLAQFPTLPKPATEAVGRSFDSPPPLRLRPTDRKVILRAADPQDRASAVAASGDLTGRRLASRARKIADQRYEDRQKKRQAEQESVGMDELETRAIMSTTAQPRGTEQ